MRKIGQIFLAFSEKLNFTTEGPINAGVVRRNVSKCLDYVNFNGVINSFAGTQLLIALSPPPSPQKLSDLLISVAEFHTTHTVILPG